MLSATRFGLLAAALAVVPQIAPAQSLSAEEILKRIQQQREVLATQPKEDPATRTIRPVPTAQTTTAETTSPAESAAVVSTQPSRQPATQAVPETAATTPAVTEEAQIVPAAVTEALPVMSDEMSINLVVFFEFNSAILKAEARDELNKLCQALALDTGSYEIIGHTDAAGSDEYNLILSRARAEAVVEHLVSRCDIAEDRLRAHGMGEKRLRNSTMPRDSVNRRVEIQVSS
ncbi:MAG: OmpA family protein [Pseudomonadota bacterium]